MVILIGKTDEDIVFPSTMTIALDFHFEPLSILLSVFLCTLSLPFGDLDHSSFTSACLSLSSSLNMHATMALLVLNAGV